jgi:hypothetical protein
MRFILERPTCLSTMFHSMNAIARAVILHSLLFDVGVHAFDDSGAHHQLPQQCQWQDRLFPCFLQWWWTAHTVTGSQHTNQGTVPDIFIT